MINMNNNIIKNIINLVLQKSFYFENQFPLISQNPMNRNNFLQKKRFLENSNLIYNNMISFQKDSNFCISNKNPLNTQKNEFHENNRKNYGLSSELISPLSYGDYNYNLNKQNYNSFIPTSNEKINKKCAIYNVNNNFFGNINNDYFNNSELKNDKKENSKEKLDGNSKENNNLANFNNFLNLSSNASYFSKNNYFNVINIKNEKTKKKIIQKKTKQTENNNEIKVLKNNKIVYVNSFLLNSYSTSKNIKKFNKITFIGRNKRSSRYRGVSKNGNQWQVLMMINKNKSYIGSYPSEELAARIYDILALKNRGIKARTNFIYNSKQIKKINEMEINIKSENINDIIKLYLIIIIIIF